MNPLRNLFLKTAVFETFRKNFKNTSVWSSIRSSHRECSVKKRCSSKFRIFHRKTPVLESLFNKTADLQTSNFIKKRLQHRCFTTKFSKILTMPILKKIWERLLLVHLSFIKKSRGHRQRACKSPSWRTKKQPPIDVL